MNLSNMTKQFDDEEEVKISDTQIDNLDIITLEIQGSKVKAYVNDKSIGQLFDDKLLEQSDYVYPAIEFLSRNRDEVSLLEGEIL